MASSNFIPSRDADLVTWTNNFSSKINLTPTAYGLSAPQATAYAALNTAFIASYTTANDPSTRSPSAIIAKDDAKKALISSARQLARIVQATPVVTDEQKSDLGLNVRATPSPIPPPDISPAIDVLSISGNTVRIRMHDPLNTTRRGLPPGISGITLFSAVGPTAPTSIAGWTFEANTTRIVADVTFPGAAPGAKVWFTCFYKNEREQSGPATEPVSTNIAGGSAMAA